MRLANDDQLMPRLKFQRTGKRSWSAADHLRPPRPEPRFQHAPLRKNLRKPRDWRHVPEDLQQLSRSQVLLPITRSTIIAGDHDPLHFRSSSPIGWSRRRRTRSIPSLKSLRRGCGTPHRNGARHRRPNCAIHQPRQNPTSLSGSNAYARDVREVGAPRRRNICGRFAAISAPEPRAEADIRSGWPRISRLARAARVADAAHVLLLRPEKLKALSKRGITDLPDSPRLLFEDETLWHTALKLKTFVDSSAGDPIYFESLGTLLIHEVVRFTCGCPAFNLNSKVALHRGSNDSSPPISRNISMSGYRLARWRGSFV